MSQVLLATVELNVFDLRNDVRQGDENRHDHEFDESSLAAGNLGRLAITEHGDFEALRLLAVTLLEKLFEEEVGPDGAEVEFSEGSADVACVDQTIRHQLLTLLNTLLARTINELIGIGAVLDLWLLQVARQLVPQLLHECHVRADDGFQDTLLKKLYLLWWVLFRNKVAFADVQKFESLGCVIAFLYAIIAVHLEAMSVRHYMIPIVKPIMLHVVAECRHKQGQGIEVVELGELGEALRLHNEVAVLRHVRAVQIVVVFHWAFVLVENLNYELHKFVAVNNGIKIVLLKQSHGHEWHLQLAANFFRKFEQVELECVYSFAIIGVSFY